jgi:hypothetical protein
MPSVFVRFRMCYAQSISKYHSIYVHILYALRSRLQMRIAIQRPHAQARAQAQSCRYGRRTCERGSIAVEGRGGVVEAWLLRSLLELLRINLIGDFFPFACAEFTAVKAPVSMSVPASKKRHCIGSSQ